MKCNSSLFCYRCRLMNGKTIWLCEKHYKSMKVTVLSAEERENRQSSKGTSDDMSMITGLRIQQRSKLETAFKSPMTAKRSLGEYSLDIFIDSHFENIKNIVQCVSKI